MPPPPSERCATLRDLEVRLAGVIDDMDRLGGLTLIAARVDHGRAELATLIERECTPADV